MTILSPVPSDSATLPKIPSPTSLLHAIFSSTGRVLSLDEKHFDACTALSGSGPAFVSIVLEAMTDGGVMMGLPRKEATELAAQTMQGAARMVLSGLHPAQLKDSVTSAWPAPFQTERIEFSTDDHSRSPRRMHDRWTPHPRGRQGPEHGCSGGSDRHPAVGHRCTCVALGAEH